MFTFHGDASEFFDEILADESGVPRGAAGANNDAPHSADEEGFVPFKTAQRETA